MLASTLAGGLSLFAEPEPERRLPATGPGFESQLQPQLDAVENELGNLRRQVEALTSLPGDAPEAAQLSRLDTTVSDVNERLTRLEGAILADPAKALQVPLLSNQIAELEEQTEAALLAQRENTDRVYDVLKVSILALAVGLLSITIANAFRGRRDEHGSSNGRSGE